MKLFKNNKQRQKTKKFIIAFLALFIVFSMILGIVAPFINASETTNSSIEITTETGFGGMYKMGTYAPVKVTLTNNGPEFTGKLNLKIDSFMGINESKYVVYTKEVSLPKGTSKEYMFNAKILTVRQTNKVELINNKNKLVETKYLKGKPKRQESILIGTLSDNDESLNYIKKSKLNINYEIDGVTEIKENLINFKPENFPENPDTLRMFSSIVIDDFDTSQLSELQVKAIEKWVSLGGILLIGTGENTEKLYKNQSFARILPDGKRNIIEDTNLIEFDMAFEQETIKDKPAILCLFNDTSFSKFELNGTNFAWFVKKIGNGNVVISPNSLSFSFIENKDEASKIITKIENRFNIESVTQYLTQTNIIQNRFSYELQGLNKTGDFNILYIIFIIVVVYAVLLGTALYFILKIKDKRDKSIIFISGFAVLTSALIIILCSGNYFTKPIIKSISNITLVPETEQAIVELGMNILTKEKGNIKVDLGSNENVDIDMYDDKNAYAYAYSYSYGPGYGPGYGYGYPSTSITQTNDSEKINKSEDIATISTDDGTIINYLKSSKWEKHFMYKNKIIENVGKIDSNIIIDENGLSGEITNNTKFDIKYPIIAVGNRTYYEMKIPVGKTINVKDFKELGQATLLQEVIITNTRENDDNSNINIGYLNFISNMLSNASGIDTNYTYIKQLTVTPNSTILDNDYDSYKICGVIENNTGILDDIRINGKIPNKEENSVFTQDLTLNINKGRIKIPSVAILPIEVIHNGKYNIEKTGINRYYIYPTGTSSSSISLDPFEIIYQLPIKIEIDKFTIGGDFETIFTEDYSKIEIYNTKTESYKELDKAFWPQNSKDFISDSNTIKIKVTPLANKSYIDNLPDIYINAEGVNNNDNN